ncbi:unnamed protein product [Linum trigynum]|uniref:Uncharacterized protein n=1 Tax=Linum trigynum TaxID=586398 RepID=A0AAV2F4X4_9ROSI
MAHQLQDAVAQQHEALLEMMRQLITSSGEEKMTTSPSPKQRSTADVSAGEELTVVTSSSPGSTDELNVAPSSSPAANDELTVASLPHVAPQPIVVVPSTIVVEETVTTAARLTSRVTSPATVTLKDKEVAVACEAPFATTNKNSLGQSMKLPLHHP